MSLADLAKGAKDGKGADLAIAIKPEPLDPIKAMAHFVKAVHASDVAGAYDAYCMLHEAHKDATDKASEGDDEPEEDDGATDDKGY
jgi:hypothetical protein